MTDPIHINQPSPIRDPLLLIDPCGTTAMQERLDPYDARRAVYGAINRWDPAFGGIGGDETIVNVTPDGMRWQMWTAAASLSGNQWGYGDLNLVAGLLPTQYGAPALTVYGPVVITADERIGGPGPATWSYLQGLADDIGLALTGREPAAAARNTPTWASALNLVAAVLRGAPRPHYAVTAGGADDEARRAVALAEERVSDILAAGWEHA